MRKEREEQVEAESYFHLFRAEAGVCCSIPLQPAQSCFQSSPSRARVKVSVPFPLSSVDTWERLLLSARSSSCPHVLDFQGLLAHAFCRHLINIKHYITPLRQKLDWEAGNSPAPHSQVPRHGSVLHIVLREWRRAGAPSCSYRHSSSPPTSSRTYFWSRRWRYNFSLCFCFFLGTRHLPPSH